MLYDKILIYKNKKEKLILITLNKDNDNYYQKSLDKDIDNHY